MNVIGEHVGRHGKSEVNTQMFLTFCHLKHAICPNNLSVITLKQKSRTLRIQLGPAAQPLRHMSAHTMFLLLFRSLTL